MALTIGKRDVGVIAQLLDEEYETAEEAAEALIVAAWELYESKAKWTVVGQLYSSPLKGYIDPNGEDVSKVALGRYGTEKQALTAARQLVFGNATAETFRAWVLPVTHGSPAEYYKLRSQVKKKAEHHGSGDGPEVSELAKFFDAHPGVLVLPEEFTTNTIEETE